MTAYISLRVLSGNQVKQRFFTGNLTVGELLPVVEFANESLAPHETYQRHLDPKRVKQCAEYILSRTPLSEEQKQLTKWSLPPILVALSGDEGAWTYNNETGNLSISLSSPLAILDGQHRCAALKSIKDKAMADEQDAPIRYQWGLIKESSLGVMFFDAPSLKERQTIFSDTNKNMRKTDKSSDLVNAADTDPVSNFSRSLVAGTSTKPKLWPFAAYEANSPSVKKGSGNLFTFAQIYQMVSLAWPETTDLQARGYLRKYMTALSVAVEPYKLATDYYTNDTVDVNIDDETLINPDFLISRYCTHLKVVTEAFGYLGEMIFTEYQKIDTEALCRAFSGITWEIEDEFFNCLKDERTGKVKGIKANKLALAEKLFSLYESQLNQQSQTNNN